MMPGVLPVTRTVGHLVAATVLYTILVFAGIDVIRLGVPTSGGETVAVWGYVLLSASLLTIFGLGCVSVTVVAARSIARLRGRWIYAGWLGSALVSLVPAVHFARVITAGRGISTSSWRLPLQLTVVAGVVAAIALLMRIAQLAPNWTKQKRLRAGVLALFLAGMAIAITNFHATTYLRIHQGILLFSSAALLVGFALMGAKSGAASTAASRFCTIRLAGLFALLGTAYPLTLHGGASRPKAGLVVFSRTVVAQKLTPLLFRLSPMYSSGRAPGSKAAFDATRLGRSNAPVVSPLSPGKYAGYNVIWVSSDAFRADALGSQYQGSTATPHLDALSRQALVFTEAVADYSHTTQSLLSVLSGRWDVTPSLKKHGADAEQDLDRSRLARLMRQSGYFTLANMMGGRSSAGHFGPGQIPGFDQHVQPGPTCLEQVEYFERFLKDYTQPKPLFAWMHIYDSHKPLQHPGEAATGRIADDYSAAIRHVDRCIGRTISALQTKGVWDRTLFVFFADHGESLGEHERLEQHSTCYLHDTRVPLLIRVPDMSAPRQEFYRIQLSDLLPTTANLIGLNVAGEPFEGDDLSGLLDKPAPTKGVAFSRGHPLQYHCAGVLSESWHLIHTKSGQFYELYDVDQDPLETTNLIGSEGPVVEQLRPLLDAYFLHYREQTHGKTVIIDR
jgi:arylsulfatase A-like enzyme